jgi:hypothetical protein
MNRREWIIVVALVLLLVPGGWLFLEKFEYRVEEQNSGFQGDARRNEYLAAERFLERFGMQIKSLPTILDLKEMPGSDDVLLIPTDRYDLAPEKIEELLHWVRKGGHLVVRARRPSTATHAEDDRLFEVLGVETHAKKGGRFATREENTVIDVQVNDRIENKNVSFDTGVWMANTSAHELTWQVDSEHGSQLLEFALEDGFVTLLGDLAFMKNDAIDKHDHAAFLYTVVHIDNTNRRLWIVRHDDMPSLFSIMWEKIPQTVMIFSVLVMTWLWYVTRRFGPVLQGGRHARRSLREHITYSGYYLWRNQNRSELFQGVKSALFEQVSRSRPLWARLESTALAAKLGKIAGLPEAQVLRVLQAETVEKETEFSQFVEVLSEIRKKL